MGEAKCRADAYAAGRPWKPSGCPACSSRMVAERDAGPMALSHVPTRYGTCGDCGAIWEAYPDDWCEEVVCAEPCDNCAFRAGAPEHGDTAEWRSLLAKLRTGQKFFCHKGAPILRSEGSVEFDGQWIKDRGRMCAGFLRVAQAWPDWLENSVAPPVHVLTTHDQDRLFAEAMAEAEGRDQ